jgi:transposase
MYLRETKRKNGDGSVARYYQLAENEWDRDKGCAVAKVIYNFGRADDLDGDKLKRLAKSILRIVSGEEALAAEEDVRVIDSWPYGGVFVLEQLWRELEINVVLADKTVFERALFAMVANRALLPYSKLYCHEQWLKEEVFLPDGQDLKLHQMYRAMDFLLLNQIELEKSVYFKMADLMNADVDLIFYDTTNVHFEVDEEDSGELTGPDGIKRASLRKRGRAKNKRDDAPLVTVGLAVTREGLPVRAWVFPGNTADVATVERVKTDLKGWRLGRCVFVGDAGMNSQENRNKLSLGGGKYILATKMRAGDEVTTDVLTRAGRYQDVAGNLQVKEVIVGDGERRQRYVVCHNPEEEKRQRLHRDQVIAELELELETLQTRQSGHTKRVCALLISARYGKYLRQLKTGELRINRAAIADAERYDGKWVVTSNDDTLSAEDLALGYKQLMRVEECWRSMKSGLRMRPVYHWMPHRIEAHIKMCVLGLLLERIAEIRAQDSWRNIVAKLDTIKVVEYVRGAARVRQTTEVRGEVAALLKKLGVPMPPKLHHVESIATDTHAPEPTDGGAKHLAQ